MDDFVEGVSIEAANLASIVDWRDGFDGATEAQPDNSVRATIDDGTTDFT